MDTINKRQQERDDNKYNKKYQVLALARRILVQGPPLMTMLEAVQEAEKQYSMTQKHNRYTV
jgi:hypothetical protein